MSFPWTDPAKGRFLREQIPGFESACEKGIEDAWLNDLYSRYFEKFCPCATELQLREVEMGETKKVTHSSTCIHVSLD